MPKSLDPTRADVLADVRRLFFSGDLAEALVRGRRLLGLAFGLTADGQAQDPQTVADVATLLARIARRQEQFDEALRWVDIALTAARADADPARECRARVQHSRILSLLGQTEEALTESYSALRAAALAGGPQSEAEALEALADVQWSMALWDDALTSYGRMLELANACAHVELQMVAHGGIGGVNHHLADSAETEGRPDAASRHYHIAGAEALEFMRYAAELGDVYSVHTAAQNHAIVLLAQGDTAGARASLEDLLLQTGDREPSVKALTLKNLADVDFEEGRFASAIARGRDALAASETLRQPHVCMECCSALSAACEKVGDLASALAYHRRFHELYVQVASASSQARARAMAVKYDTDKAHAVAAAQRVRADRLESRQSSLAIEAQKLARLSLEDALTGIGNRRRFDQALQAESDSADPGRSCSLALLDIDHFKRVNDECSHQVGDAVLRRIGAILASNSRRDDIPARYGGEEFALILTGLGSAAARQVCERVRLAVETEDWRALHPLLRVTISIGLAHQSSTSAVSDLQALLTLADRRLYAAKEGGRNRVVDRGFTVPGFAATGS
ncbi:MAG: GGDEF domain-containing protein [Burkholderiales bacterium]